MLCLPPHRAQAQQRTDLLTGLVQQSEFSLAKDGTFSLRSDAVAAARDTNQVLSAAYYSPYIPQAAVFNAKEAPIRVSLEEKSEGGKDIKNWFFQIPDSIMGRMFLASTNLAQTPPSFQFVQQQVGEGMYTFVLSTDKKHILIKDCSSWVDTDTLDAISKAVDISNSLPIVASLKVESSDSGVYKVNANPILLSESYMTLASSVKQGYMISQNDPSRSTVNSIHSYPQNIEIRTTRTYPRMGTNDVFYTVGLNTSLILLPKTPMQRRLSDPRHGMRSISATHFSDNQQKVETTQMLTRWRLEPKNAEDARLQQNGTLIEPKKPIVYYIDPAFSPKWIPYIKDGVKEWQKAFERAGWKNAIYALEWPKNDSTMSFEDARYNIIRLSPEMMTYVFGNNRVWDYRSGEYLNSYIFFCQGALQNMRTQYVAECGAADIQAHSPVLPDSLMGALIQHSIAKAVAPTIGLLDNNLASSLTPTDSLRSKAFVKKYSIAPSITDELPYNYVAQPGDGLTRNELIPRVSDGDEWTVMLGYKNFGFDDPEQERQHISQLLTDSLLANPRLAFATKGGNINDPLCKVRDLGDDQPKALSYMLDNLQRIAPVIATWGETVTDFTEDNRIQGGYWSAMRTELSFAQNILANNFTGMRYKPLPAGVDGSVYSFSSKEHLEKCLDLFFRLYANRPAWLYPESYAHKFNLSLPEQAGIGNCSLLPMEMHSIMLYHLNPNFDRMEFAQRIYDECVNRSPAEISKDLYSRVQQGAMVAVLLGNLTFKAEGFKQMGPIGRAISLHFLRQAQTDFQKALASAPDEISRNHYTLLLQQIHDALDTE